MQNQKTEKYIKLATIQQVEKQIRKGQKDLRRLKPKVQKSLNNYNRVLKSYEDGEKYVQLLLRKRDELLLEFKEME